MTDKEKVKKCRKAFEDFIEKNKKYNEGRQTVEELYRYAYEASWLIDDDLKEYRRGDKSIDPYRCIELIDQYDLITGLMIALYNRDELGLSND